jgi:hypothetical protein
MKIKTWLMAIGAVLVAAPLAAQDPVTAQKVLEKQQQEMQLQKVQEMKATLAVHARVTRGAPYSAETTTESIQALADGNRIVHRNATRVYRDAEGRTRTEELGETGVLGISISDPVSGETFKLDPATRMAYRSGVVVLTTGGAVIEAKGAPGSPAIVTTTRTADGHVVVEAKGAGSGGVAGGVVSGSGRDVVTVSHAGVAGGVVTVQEVDLQKKIEVLEHQSNETRTKEDLGQQVIEGVTATGTRTTTVIPAGAMGNEQPVRIVSEQWFSPDLQLLVLTKYSDPRTGETTFRLSNIARGEPDRSLFVVPPDYTLKSSVIKREMQ